ncbi:MAG: UDP-N-acetylglucosamine 2-epimerase [Phycisphaerae bacterium]
MVTGTRAEYGLLKSTMQAIQQRRDLTLQLVVTGMHLLPRFGRTVDAIAADGWTIDARIPMQSGSDDPLDQATGLGRGVGGLAEFYEKAGTDIVVVLGDRIEATAAALAAVTTGRLLAHIHGGDVAPGDIDDSLRNAITKLAHLHLPATRAAARRIVRMGEAPDRVHVVGAPGLDDLAALLNAAPASREKETSPRRTVEGRGGGIKPFTGTGRALIVHHPVGRSPAVERRVMAALLSAVRAGGLARTILYPCSDRGHSGIVDAIEAHRRQSTNGSVRVVKSLERDQYLKSLIESDVLVGNSSSGIIEAPFAGTPSVNIGPRQHGRQRNGRAVIDADETRASILAAVRKAAGRRPRPAASDIYGDGNAGMRIAARLADIPRDARFRHKSLT